MCGIAGELTFTGKSNRERIQTMTDTLVHRGPDHSEVFCHGPVSLGHRRLSIIDLSSAANQPMTSADDRYTIVYNGEVYNFKELRKELETKGVIFQTHSDTEVILTCYVKYGKDTPKKLRGMFAFAIWDSKKQELFLARDRVGQKPLKYYIDDSRLVFASELKAILTHPDVPKDIDYDAIDAFLTYKYVPAPKTGFAGIHKLEPGHSLTIDSAGKQKKEQYWKLSYEPKLQHSEKEWMKVIEQTLEEAVKLRLIADVPLGAHLSGGIDSSLIVAMMAKYSDKPVQTFSIGFAEDEFNELPYAKMVAEQYNTDHHEYTVSPDALGILEKIAYHYEEPYADASAIPSWYLSEKTRESVTVALNGDGGDENFAGYDRYKAGKLHHLLKFIPAKSTLRKLTSWLYAKTNKNAFWQMTRLLKAYDNDIAVFFERLIAYVSDQQKQSLYTETFREHLSHNNHRLKNIFEQHTKLGTIDQMLAVGVETHLADDLLPKVDIASMAHGLEVRSPMLDHKFMELAAHMPEQYKLRANKQKYILQKLAEKFLPPECINRKKQGFVLPISEWFRTDIYLYAKDKLTDGTLKNIGINDKQAITLLEAHATKKADHTNELWALLMLRLWLGTWFSST